MTLSAASRRARARLGAYTLHATHDSRETSKPGRDAAFARFEQEVDPRGELRPEERRRRAIAAQRAHMQRIALKSAETRRKKQQKRAKASV